MMRILIVFLFLFYVDFSYSQSINSYCAFDSYGDKYELNLENGTGRLTYNKYDRNGIRVQMLNGTWELRDEGVYGPAEKVTVFVNGGVLKFLVIRTSRGDVQELRAESGGKIWSQCGGVSAYSGGSSSPKPIEYNPNAKAIIGEAKIIGTLIIAQYDMPEVLDWWDAVDECKRLGDGWRLPILSELNVMFQNKDLIGIVSNGYWSISQDPGTSKAWAKKFGSGEQVLIEKKWPGKVRAVKTAEK